MSYWVFGLRRRSGCCREDMQKGLCGVVLKNFLCSAVQSRWQETDTSLPADTTDLATRCRVEDELSPNKAFKLGLCAGLLNPLFCWLDRNGMEWDHTSWCLGRDLAPCAGAACRRGEGSLLLTSVRGTCTERHVAALRVPRCPKRFFRDPT